MPDTHDPSTSPESTEAEREQELAVAPTGATDEAETAIAPATTAEAATDHPAAEATTEPEPEPAATPEASDISGLTAGGPVAEAEATVPAAPEHEPATAAPGLTAGAITVGPAPAGERTPEALRLRRGRVIDPVSGLDGLADVLVVDGDIAAVAPANAVDRLLSTMPHVDLETVDCHGMVVTPGLIDMHAHVFPGLGDFCVRPDRAGVETGVPTVVDGGTSGVATFGLARAWLEASAPTTKVLAFVDPNQLYLATGDFICHKLRIADDERNLDLDSTAAALEAHADIVVGMKVRATHVGDDNHSPFLSGAQKVSGGRPVMVHLGRFPHTPTITSPALLTTLRGGDIITHAFRAGGGQLDPIAGGVTPEFEDAVERGVRLDVGHSATDFRFRTARRLFEAGYFPHSISTDLNIYNVDGPVGSLPETMSKIWALGVALPDVIGMATSGPAASIRRSDELGTLAAGRKAEISVLRIVEGPAQLSDGHETITAERRLVPIGCVRAGHWHAAAPSFLSPTSPDTGPDPDAAAAVTAAA